MFQIEDPTSRVVKDETDVQMQKTNEAVPRTDLDTENKITKL